MTTIEWTDESWNPVTGCSKVSQGCKHCYAERLAPKVFAGQQMRVHYHELPGTPLQRPRMFTDVLTHPDRLEAPLHWKKPRRIFVNSMSDLFHEDVPDEFIDQVFAVMAKARQHTFQILTKRPERMLRYMTDQKRVERVFVAGHETPLCGRYSPPPWPLPNVWLGVSVEDQATADERIPQLLQTPAAVRFISAEPLLGPVDLSRLSYGNGFYATALFAHDDEAIRQPRLDWVIAGGESGPKARPSHPDWFRSLRDQCAAAGVPYFFKQWGEWCPERDEDARYGEFHAGADWVASCMCSEGDGPLFRLGKKAAGRTLDGRTHDDYPEAKP